MGIPRYLLNFMKKRIQFCLHKNRVLKKFQWLVNFCILYLRFRCTKALVHMGPHVYTCIPSWIEIPLADSQDLARDVLDTLRLWKQQACKKFANYLARLCKTMHYYWKTSCKIHYRISRFLQDLHFFSKSFVWKKLIENLHCS